MTFNPFPGLRSFEPNEEHLFFGRERQVDELLLRLGRTRFLAVVGTSGCGKSSLIRSGLLPALYSGFMAKAGSTWRVALFRPGDDPIGNLALALNSPDVLGRGGPAHDIENALIQTTLRRSARGLVDAVRHARIPPQDNVLIIVDQFEELFRFKNTRAGADARDDAVAFAKLLLEAARDQAVPIYVVLTMRSDFIGHCTEFPGLPEAVNEGQFLVPRMTRDELRLAITGPVAVAEGRIAARLTTRLLNDVGDDPDQLPVLQHALMRTWTHWEEHGVASGALDVENYEAIGTMRKALSEHAEEAYAELPTERARQIAQRMFKGLTELNHESGGIRRPCRVDELSGIVGATTAEVIDVIDHFRAPGRSFLMPSADVPLHAASIVDISHESLMRVWSRLADWALEEARSAGIYRRLAHAARLYAGGEVGLWRDPELQLALGWRDMYQPTAAWARRYDPDLEDALAFLTASEKARNDAAAEQERQRHRRLVVTRRVAVAMGLLSIVGVALAVVAFALGNEARAQKATAEREAARAHVAATLAENERQRALEREQEARAARGLAESEATKARLEQQRADRQADVARQAEEAARRSEELAKVAETLARTAEAKERAAAAEAQASERNAVEQAHAAVEARKQADVAREAATKAARETERLARLALARALAGLAQRPWEPATRDVAKLLARQAYLYHTANQGSEYDPDIFAGLTAALGEAPRFEPHLDAVRAIAIDDAGQRLATAGDDGRVRLFDAGDPARVATVLGAEPRGLALSPIRALSFDTTGQLLAVGSIDEPLRVWDVRAPDKPVGEAPVTGVTTSVVFDGRRIVSSGFSGSSATGFVSHVNVWSLEPLQLEHALIEKHPHRIHAIAASRATEQLAAASDNGVLLWPSGSRESKARLLAEGRQVSAVAFSRDGRWLSAGTREGQVLTWDLSRDAKEPVTTPAHAAAVTGLSYSRDGLIASSSLDGTVKLIAPNASPMPLANGVGWVWAVAFAPDGDRVFSGGSDKRVQALTTRADLLAEQVCRVVGRNLRVDEWKKFVSDAEAYQATCPNHAAGDAR